MEPLSKSLSTWSLKEIDQVNAVDEKVNEAEGIDADSDNDDNTAIVSSTTDLRASEQLDLPISTLHKPPSSILRSGLLKLLISSTNRWLC